MKIRSILAVAALTAGVTWMAAGSAAAADLECEKKGGLVKTTSSTVAVCDDVAGLTAAGGYGWRMNVPADNHVMRSAEMLAQRAGLPGLSRASAVLSVADAAGVGAGAGVPAVPVKVPTGLENVTEVVEMPDLPGLPATAVTPATPADRLPEALAQLRRAPDPMAPVEQLPAPVAETRQQVEETVERAVTQTVPKVQDVTERVPLSEPEAEGLPYLLDGLRLGN